METPTFPELGCYTLAGGARDPRALITDCADAERIGLGSVFISERFDVKEAMTLSGAAAAVTNSVRIVTAATNLETRHPIVTASAATTLHRLSGGRFVLGIGRGIAARSDAYGLPRITTAHLEEFATLMRRLWRGETVTGHESPLGNHPFLRLDPTFDEDIPLGLVAFGPETLRLGGRAFDHVILHTFFTDETLERSVRTVKEAAAAAGRDPASVTVWACYATVGDHLDADTRLLRTVGRLATYLQAYGDLLVSTNRWNPEVLARFRADEVVRSVRGAIDVVAGPAELEHIAGLLPADWLAPAATGTPAECAAAVRHQLELGADAVIMHGATPAELEPVVAAYASRGDGIRQR